jgi:hypothetical protein
MERAMLIALLARAEQQLAFGKEQINDQYRLIAALENDGHDTTAAINLLKEFIDTQQDNEDDRDRLLARLAEAS